MRHIRDIVVVGAGPAGLCFARALDGSDLTVAAVEKSPAEVLANPPFDAREIALTHPSRRLLSELGVWDLIPDEEKYRLRDADVYDGMSDFKLHFPQPRKALGEETDRLGYLTPNHLIRKAAYEAVKDQRAFDLMAGREVVGLSFTDRSVVAKLDDGDEIEASLLVCADSRFSKTRQMAGIPADTHQFGRTVVCFRAKHELANESTANECFHYGRTLAILPLSEHLSSMVVTMDSDRIGKLVAMNDEQLAQDIYAETKGRLGKIEIASERCVYPLVGVHARRFYGRRVALIGDAAVGMHPVTAHGFNLGLMSVGSLSQLVRRERKRGRDVGSASMLAKYNVRHMARTRPLYHGTNFVVKLFTDERAPAKAMRRAVLRASNVCPPVKAIISKQLTG